LAASAQEKAQARSSLNQVTASLRSVDTAYASDNAAEAQSKFEEAKSNWDKVSPPISAREARQAQQSRRQQCTQGRRAAVERLS
jgi:hypothetical protein